MRPGTEQRKLAAAISRKIARQNHLRTLCEASRCATDLEGIALFPRVFHAPSWHFRTFAPCARAPRSNRSGAIKFPLIASGAIKLPLKAAALARQRPTRAFRATRGARSEVRDAPHACVPSDARSAERGEGVRLSVRATRGARSEVGAFLAPRCRTWLRVRCRLPAVRCLCWPGCV